MSRFCAEKGGQNMSQTTQKLTRAILEEIVFTAIRGGRERTHEELYIPKAYRQNKPSEHPKEVGGKTLVNFTAFNAVMFKVVIKRAMSSDGYKRLEWKEGMTAATLIRKIREG